MLARLTALLAASAAVLLVVAASGGAAGGPSNENKLKQVEHIVVIYEENHSFDNLYGGWEGVNGLGNADAAHTAQLGQTGPSSFAPYECLYQDDANLQAKSAANPSAPLDDTCDNTTGGAFPSHFRNAPFSIDDYISPDDVTCPPVLSAFSFPNGLRKGGINPATGQVVPGARSGGCTRDIVHRFYHEIFQLNGGQQNRYALGSDAAGLVMGTYDTTKLPVYHYLHDPGHPKYAILDNYFQAAFGGSYLNHQWLVAAATPVCTRSKRLSRERDALGARPQRLSRCSLASGIEPPARDGRALHIAGHRPRQRRADAVVWPVDDGRRLRLRQLLGQHADAGLPADVGVSRRGSPAQTNPTIGDRLTGSRRRLGLVLRRLVERQWQRRRAGLVERDRPRTDAHRLLRPERRPDRRGLAGVPGQPVPVPPPAVQLLRALHDGDSEGLANRAAHLRDEQEFIQLANGSTNHCDLPPVSFIKPIGEENEHPGYASEPNGSDHLVSLLQSIEGSKCKENTMVIVTYDEFGGEWDHVPPPGQGNSNGPHDQWGPGTRIPALVLSPHLKGPFVVDSTQYDTTSILATIEQKYGLAALSSRDAAVNSLSNVFDAH